MKIQTLLIPEPERLEESAALAKKYHAAFEYNDFFLPEVYGNKQEVEKRIRLYQSLNRDTSKDILHGAFLDMTVHSSDSVIAEYSKQCIRQSMEIGKRLQVKGVVFHTGLLANFKQSAYVKNWLKKNEGFFRQLCAEYTDLEVYMENMFDQDPELLTAFAEKMKDVTNFGICLDYAHAALTPCSQQEWMCACMPYIKHMHINDNNQTEDQHRPVGTGSIDWKQWKEQMKTMEKGKAPSVLIEVQNLEAYEESMRFLGNLLED